MSGISHIPAVRLTSVFKQYGKNTIVLNGLNMTVRKGTIYGLLGPSGCGKTTLLSCIVGRTRIDSGELQVIYTEKSQLGYMPQDIALFDEFTIEEAFMFYGTVFGLTKNQIDSRLNYLTKLLELPDIKRIIKLCSGGQQRRVSMGVTFFHDPELLILDEPTVGVDPLLSDRIWKYLVEIVSKENKTIIITTHYIEEAKHAHCIGLMRGGILIAENNPKILMAQENADSLEQAFLQLSIKQQTMDMNKELTFQIEGKTSHKTFVKNEIFNQSRFWAQYKKNYLSAKGQPVLTCYTVLLPILCTYFLNAAFYHLPLPQPIGILNEDGFSCNYTEIVEMTCYPQPSEPLSCLFIQLLDNPGATWIYHNSWDEAVASINFKTNSFIHFKPNFSVYLMEKFVRTSKASSAAAQDSFVFVYSDTSGWPYQMNLGQVIMKTWGKFLDKLGDKCNYSPGFGDIPVIIQQIIYGDMYGLIAQLASKYLTAFITFANLTFAASNLNTAINSGCFERDRISGLTLVEIFGAQALFQFYMLVFQNISILVIMYGIFDALQVGSIYLLLFTLCLVGIIGYFYGILIGVLFKDTRTVNFAAVGFFLTLFMLNGFVWPIEGYHWIIKPVGFFWSRFYGGDMYVNVSLRGKDLTHFNVWTDAILLTCHIGLAAAACYLIVKRKSHIF